MNMKKRLCFNSHECYNNELCEIQVLQITQLCYCIPYHTHHRTDVCVSQHIDEIFFWLFLKYILP